MKSPDPYTQFYNRVKAEIRKFEESLRALNRKRYGRAKKAAKRSK